MTKTKPENFISQSHLLLLLPFLLSLPLHISQLHLTDLHRQASLFPPHRQHLSSSMFFTSGRQGHLEGGISLMLNLNTCYCLQWRADNSGMIAARQQQNLHPITKRDQGRCIFLMQGYTYRQGVVRQPLNEDLTPIQKLH